MLEPFCVSLAAQRPDRKRIAARLDALNEEGEALIGQSEAFTAVMLRFHAALAEAADNVTLSIVVGTIEQIWQGQERAWAERASAEGAYPDEKDQRKAVASHRRITDLIRSGDAEGAMTAARKHLAASTSYVNGTRRGGAPSTRVGDRVVDATQLRV